jgi:hypothetical protein
MKLRIPGTTNDQPTRMAIFQSSVFTLWPFVLPGMSRNIIFDFGMLLVPQASDQATGLFASAITK